MTCKDCIHSDVCRYKFFHLSENHYTLDSKNVEYVCKCFKDKSKCIELPCKVGDVVYAIKNNKICAKDVVYYNKIHSRIAEQNEE